MLSFPLQPEDIQFEFMYGINEEEVVCVQEYTDIDQSGDDEGGQLFLAPTERNGETGLFSITISTELADQPSTPPTMVGCTPAELDSLNELIHFDHMYYRQSSPDPVRLQDPVCPLDPPVSPLTSSTPPPLMDSSFTLSEMESITVSQSDQSPLSPPAFETSLINFYETDFTDDVRGVCSLDLKEDDDEAELKSSFSSTDLSMELTDCLNSLIQSEEWQKDLGIFDIGDDFDSICFPVNDSVDSVNSSNSSGNSTDFSFTMSDVDNRFNFINEDISITSLTDSFEQTATNQVDISDVVDAAKSLRTDEVQLKISCSSPLSSASSGYSSDFASPPFSIDEHFSFSNDISFADFYDDSYDELLFPALSY